MLRGAFCFEVSRLRSYELGSAEHRLAAVTGMPEESEQQEEKPVVRGHHVDLSQRLDELSRAYEALQHDMLNVQHLACLHDARLNRLEVNAAPDM